MRLFCGFLSPSHVLTNADLKTSLYMWRTWLFNTFDWSSSLRISLVRYPMSNWFSTEFHSMGRNIFNSLDQLSWKPTYYRPSFLLPETTNLCQPVSKACYFSWVSTSLPIGPILLSPLFQFQWFWQSRWSVCTNSWWYSVTHRCLTGETWSSKGFGPILKRKTWDGLRTSGMDKEQRTWEFKANSC